MPLFLTWAFSVAVAAKAVVHRGLRFGGLFGAFFITVGSLGLVLGAAFPDWYRSVSTRAWRWWGWGWGRRR